jgi:hypothetical protein
MYAQLPEPNQQIPAWIVCDLSTLPVDFRRMLSVQFREFVHCLEDVQMENELERSPRVIGFLERCYDEAA